MPRSIRWLCELSAREVAEIHPLLQASDSVPIQVHPYYWGCSRAEVQEHYDAEANAILEFGETPSVSFGRALSTYRRYLVRRRLFVRSLHQGFGILFEETGKEERSLLLLERENPNIQWLTVSTERGIWTPRVLGSSMEGDAWTSIATMMCRLNMHRLEVFGAMAGNYGHCVPKTIRSLRTTGYFDSVEFVSRASFC